jgi:hypothetical protein
MTIGAPYVAPAVATRRANTAIATADRAAGNDVNVSNITVASHANGADVQITRIDRSEPARARDRGRARRERRRQRELERSRRAMNRAQYQLTKRQEKHARRRAERGLPPQQVIPAGPRIARSDGKPIVAYRHDRLSNVYRKKRSAQVADAASHAQARRDQARQVAATLVSEHGYRLVVEDCNISAWSRAWGHALAAFAPGVVITAIEREEKAVARIAGASTGLLRASTRTALSQHCPCGVRVEKTLGDRRHSCLACGLEGDRDAVSAVLASFVSLEDPARADSAIVDYDSSRAALASIHRAFNCNSYQGWQGTLSESNAPSARESSLLTWTWWTPDAVVVARRNVGVASCSTPNETSVRWTTSDRTRTRADLPDKRSPTWVRLWDSP